MKSSERIQRYLDGEMSQEELLSFHQDLQNKPDLKEELDLHRLVDKSLRQKKEWEFRKKLEKSYHHSKDKPKNPASEKKSPCKKGYFFLAFAATLIAGVFLIMPFSKPNKDSLFEEYFKPVDLNFGSRGGGLSAQDNDLASGIEAYYKLNYKLSEHLLLTYLSKETANRTVANFFLGLSYVELQNFSHAEQCFKNVILEEMNYYQEHSRWFLALVLLKSDQLEEAKQLFAEISAEGTVHSQKSKEILKKITRIK